MRIFVSLHLIILNNWNVQLMFLKGTVDLNSKLKMLNKNEAGVIEIQHYERTLMKFMAQSPRQAGTHIDR